MLGFSIDEWLALPWWQRRVYVEQMQEEAQEREAAASGQPAGSGNPFADVMADLEAEAAR